MEVARFFVTSWLDSHNTLRDTAWSYLRYKPSHVSVSRQAATLPLSPAAAAIHSTQFRPWPIHVLGDRREQVDRHMDGRFTEPIHEAEPLTRIDHVLVTLPSPHISHLASSGSRIDITKKEVRTT
jgi:hypothetical protein